MYIILLISTLIVSVNCYQCSHNYGRTIMDRIVTNTNKKLCTNTKLLFTNSNYNYAYKSSSYRNFKAKAKALLSSQASDVDVLFSNIKKYFRTIPDTIITTVSVIVTLFIAVEFTKFMFFTLLPLGVLFGTGKFIYDTLSGNKSKPQSTGNPFFDEIYNSQSTFNSNYNSNYNNNYENSQRKVINPKQVYDTEIISDTRDSKDNSNSNSNSYDQRMQSLNEKRPGLLTQLQNLKEKVGNNYATTKEISDKLKNTKNDIDTYRKKVDNKYYVYQKTKTNSNNMITEEVIYVEINDNL